MSDTPIIIRPSAPDAPLSILRGLLARFEQQQAPEDWQMAIRWCLYVGEMKTLDGVGLLTPDKIASLAIKHRVQRTRTAIRMVYRALTAMLASDRLTDQEREPIKIAQRGLSISVEQPDAMNPRVKH
jgi:hypothetical protein